MRSALNVFVREKYRDNSVNTLASDDYLLLNGRAIFTKVVLEQMMQSTQTMLYKLHGEIVAGFIKTDDLDKIDKNTDGTLDFDNIKEWKPLEKDKVKILEYPWNFIHENAAEITSDFKLTTQGLNGQNKRANRCVFDVIR